MDSCLFCKIIAGQIPSDKVYEDDRCYAFRDINPQAPVHILIVPKTHVADVAECTEKDSALAGHVLKVASELAKREGLTNGFRLVTNAGAIFMCTCWAAGKCLKKWISFRKSHTNALKSPKYNGGYCLTVAWIYGIIVSVAHPMLHWQ